MSAPAARWKTEPAPVEPAPMYDLLVERPSADPWRLAYINERLAELSGGVR